ncbi:MAG: DUF2339 domain-containing protein [Candidatus Spyradenecus sp.]
MELLLFLLPLGVLAGFVAIIVNSIAAARIARENRDLLRVLLMRLPPQPPRGATPAQPKSSPAPSVAPAPTPTPAQTKSIPAPSVAPAPAPTPAQPKSSPAPSVAAVPAPTPAQPKSSPAPSVAAAPAPTRGATPAQTKINPPPAPVAEGAEGAVDEFIAKVGDFVLDWLLVRGRFAPKQAMPYEAALAVHWLIRAGVLTVIVGASFLVRWLIEHSLLGPLGRVVLLTAAGAALIGVGLRLLRGRYRLLGEGSAAVGTVLLYFTVYAATMRFGLVPLAVGFGLMGALTLGAGAMALGLRLPSVATLVAAGGLLTPAFLPAPNPNLAHLYLYLGILISLIIAGALWRKWEALTAFACLLTWGITLVAGQHALSSAWTLALHLLWLLACFGHLMRRQWRVPVVAYAALPAAEGLFWIGRLLFTCGDYANFACALTLAGTYAALSALLWVRGERQVLWVTGPLAILLAASAPLWLPSFVAKFGFIALLHAGLVMAIVELGHRLRDPILAALGRFAALCLLVLFAFSGLGTCFAYADPRSNPIWLNAALRCLAALLLTAHSLWRTGDKLRAVFGGGALWFLLTALATLLFQKSDCTLVSVSCTWGLYALVLLALGLWLRNRPTRLCALGLLALTLGKVFLIDLAERSLLLKMLAALPLGLLLILGAWLYLRLSPREPK